MGAGLVNSLARPGGNITGLSSLSPDLSTKRLEILKDAIPKLARVGLLRAMPTPTGPSNQLKEIRAAALALNIKLEEIDTSTRSQKFRQCVSNRKAETGYRANDAR